MIGFAHRGVTDSFPAEVLIMIIEHCNIDTALELRLPNKATNTLVEDYQKQIAAVVANGKESSCITQ